MNIDNNYGKINGSGNNKGQGPEVPKENPLQKIIDTLTKKYSHTLNSHENEKKEYSPQHLHNSIENTILHFQQLLLSLQDLIDLENTENPEYIFFSCQIHNILNLIENNMSFPDLIENNTFILNLENTISENMQRIQTILNTDFQQYSSEILGTLFKEFQSTTQDKKNLAQLNLIETILQSPSGTIEFDKQTITELYTFILDLNIFLEKKTPQSSFLDTFPNLIIDKLTLPTLLNAIHIFSKKLNDSYHTSLNLEPHSKRNISSESLSTFLSTMSITLITEYIRNIENIPEHDREIILEYLLFTEINTFTNNILSEIPTNILIESKAWEKYCQKINYIDCFNHYERNKLNFCFYLNRLEHFLNKEPPFLTANMRETIHHNLETGKDFLYFKERIIHPITN